MKFIQLDPPGTWLTNYAFMQLISSYKEINSFIEIGPGEGKMSDYLCSKGFVGTGIEYSNEIIPILENKMRCYIDKNQYNIINDDFRKIEHENKVDLIFSMMVLEHIEDDLNFINKMKAFLKPGGVILVAVPGQSKKWGIEDEVSGHFRRYDRGNLKELYTQASLSDIKIWSSSVPIANLLFYFSNLTIKKSEAVNKKTLTKEAQTKASGFRDVPFKNIFPTFFKLFLNRFIMWPFCVFQQLFYHTNYGLTYLASGRR